MPLFQQRNCLTIIAVWLGSGTGLLSGSGSAVHYIVLHVIAVLFLRSSNVADAMYRLSVMILD